MLPNSNGPQKAEIEEGPCDQRCDQEDFLVRGDEEGLGDRSNWAGGGQWVEMFTDW